jgi:hypothetical protein
MALQYLSHTLKSVEATLESEYELHFIFVDDGSTETHLVDEERLKELLKSALVEVLEERKDLVSDVIEEALEDVALIRAIEEGNEVLL